MANKGPWSPLIAYLTVGVVNQYFVTLPSTVEIPLRVNFDTNPAFPRDKLYEFTMNGPGAGPAVDWSWSDTAEATVDPTTGVVTNATHKVIKLGQAGSLVTMLVRLNTTQVTSMSQFIPLHSKVAVILMLKALECYRRGTPQDFQLGQQQEEQALKFLTEEQTSRNIFTDISKAMDSTPIMGYSLHVNNAVLVSDIYDEASTISGGIGKQHVFDRISEAVEVLANKSQWDGMTAYLDIIPTGDIVGLPSQVEIPIKININKRPSLSRTRLFEFSLNGPGTDQGDVQALTWTDQGSSPILVPLSTPSPVSVSGDIIDTNKNVVITGFDTSGLEQTVTLPISPVNEGSPIIFTSITKVVKDITLRPVSIWANFQLLSQYLPSETNPMYRLIKLNAPASEIKIMFRKSSLLISSVTDFIPLKSRNAILFMMRSLQLLKTPQLTADIISSAKALEDQATKLLQEEEQSRLSYIQASAKETLPAIGTSTENSIDTVVVADVYDDAADIFGVTGRLDLFNAISDAMEYLSNKSQWDGLDGYVDIISDQRGYLTLPPKVEVPIGMNFCRTPAQIRSKWYEFHSNGWGTTDPRSMSYNFDDMGQYPIFQEPHGSLRLFVVTYDSTDLNTQLRAYGYDTNGNFIHSVENGKNVAGELVPINIHDPQNNEFSTTSNYFRQISRIVKEVSNSSMILYGIHLDTDTPQMLSRYDSGETEPLYRRLRVPTWVKWARMRYRKRTMKIRNMNDSLNLKSKTALVLAMQAMKELMPGGDLQKAEIYEQKAIQLANEEQQSRNPGETFDLQWDARISWADHLQNRRF